jgi:hypothetical protein
VSDIRANEETEGDHTETGSHGYASFILTSDESGYAADLTYATQS